MSRPPTCLWLLAILANARAFSLYQPSHNISKPPADYHVIARELSRNCSLAIAYVDRTTGEERVKIYVAIIGENSRTNSQCSIDLSSEGGNVVVGSLNRLSAKRVLLSVHHELGNGYVHSKLLRVDLLDCSSTPLPLPKQHLVVTYRDSDKFDLLIADRRVCRSASGRCRISYDDRLNASSAKPLDVDLDWPTLRAEYTPTRDLLISGLDTVGVFKFTLLDRAFGSRRDLLALPNARNMEFVTSQFSVCWIEKPAEDRDVHCSEFDEDGELLLRKTVTYREPVTLVALQALRPGRQLLLVGKARCEGDWDCWNLFVTQVQADMKIWSTQYTEHFECSGNERRLALAARLVNDSVVAEYVCDNGRSFTYKNYVIDTTDQ